MAVLEWDNVGDRVFQTGVDKGVLYPHGAPGVAWNGITGVEHGSDSEVKSFYLDGIKILQSSTPGDFSGKLKAFTYPDEFDELTGVATPGNGLQVYEQPLKPFDLCYRTKVSNDVEEDHDYKIHVFYNLLAVPDTASFGTLGESTVTPTEFSWSLSGTPPIGDEYTFPQFRPTTHVSFNWSQVPEEALPVVEGLLYGTGSSDPRAPTPVELYNFFILFDNLYIIDNGDGTWTAVDGSDTYLTMTDPTTFELVDVDAVYLDPDTYNISDTDAPTP